MITKETFLRIKELSSLGVSARKIALQIGLSHNQVSEYLKKTDEEFDRQYEINIERRKDYETYRVPIIEILTKFPTAKPSEVANRLQVEFPDFKYSTRPFNNYLKRIRVEQGILLPERQGTQKHNVHHALRETPLPGYEAEVDFGEKVMKDMYGKNRRIYIFTMVMTFSNLLFCYCSYENFTTESAIEAHRKAFEFYGGRTKTILYDNDTVFNYGHNFGEPILTEKFQQFVDEIGFAPRFCKPRQPGSKGTIEVGVRSVKTFLGARSYTGIDSLNSELLEWLDTVQNARKSEAKGATAHEMFEEEAPALIKVPKHKKEQTIFAACSDNVVRYKHNQYELPMYRAVKGARIAIIDEGETLVFTLADTGEFLCRHPKCTEHGRRIALKDKDITEGRSSMETLVLRFRNEELVKEFCKKGKEVNPRYIITLCRRIKTISQYVPESVIFDGMKWCMEHERFTVKEFQAYIEYRNFGHFLAQCGDRDRRERRVRAAEIMEEIENG